MSELPKGWAATTLGGIVELKYGKSLPEKSRIPGAVNVYGSNGVVGTHTSGVTAAPAVIVGRKGSIGESHFSETVCFPIDTTYFVDEFECIEPRFAWHLFRFLPLREMNRASAIPGLNREDAYALPLALPPLPEQRRIVAKIDSLTSKSRRARDHLDHISRLVEKYKQAILAAAFRGDAEVARVGDVTTDIRYGTAKKCGYDGGAVPVLRIPNVQGGRIELGDMKSADFGAEELLKLKLQTGDILVIRSNGSLDLVGRSAVVDDGAAGMLFAGYLIRLRLDVSRCLPQYLHWFLQSSVARNAITNAAKSTSGVNNVNAQELQSLELPLPSIATQKERIARIESAITWINRLTADATGARKLIDHLDQSVLAKAFKGELVAQDPADEPASALLDRIRAERAAAPKAKRGRKKAV